MAKKKDKEKPAKHVKSGKKDKTGKKDGGKGGKKSGNNAFSKDYEPPESHALDGIYELKLSGALDKKTGNGRALVIEGNVIVDKKTKVKFSHYCNYENANDNAVAMARATLDDLSEILGVDVDLEEMMDALNDSPKLFAKVKTKDNDGYKRPDITRFVSPDDVDED